MIDIGGKNLQALGAAALNDRQGGTNGNRRRIVPAGDFNAELGLGDVPCFIGDSDAQENGFGLAYAQALVWLAGWIDVNGAIWIDHHTINRCLGGIWGVNQ